nr:hypothetical protein [Streptomyces coffeae]
MSDQVDHPLCEGASVTAADNLPSDTWSRLNDSIGFSTLRARRTVLRETLWKCIRVASDGSASPTSPDSNLLTQ